MPRILEQRREEPRAEERGLKEEEYRMEELKQECERDREWGFVNFRTLLPCARCFPR